MKKCLLTPLSVALFSVLTSAVFVAPTSSYAARSTALASTSAPNWEQLVTSTQFESWVGSSGEFNKDNTLTIADGTVLQGQISDGSYRGSVIGITGFGKVDKNVSGERTLIVGDGEGTVTLDMTGNPHAGLYLFRRGYHQTTQYSTPPPSLNIKGSVAIKGDMQGQTIRYGADVATGILITGSKLHVTGDLTIDLTGMKAPEALVEDGPEYADKKSWDGVFSWSNFDWREPGRRDSHLLLTGISQGYSDFIVDRKVAVSVSGQDGYLIGWFTAPSATIPAASASFANLPFDQGTHVNGDVHLKVDAPQQAKNYGVAGAYFTYSYNYFQNQGKISPFHFDGAFDIDVNVDSHHVQTRKTSNNAGPDDLTGIVYGLRANGIDLHLNRTAIDIDIRNSTIDKSVIGAWISFSGVTQMQFGSSTQIGIQVDKTSKVGGSITGLALVDIADTPSPTLEISNLTIQAQQLNPDYQGNVIALRSDIWGFTEPSWTGDTILRAYNASSTGGAYSIYLSSMSYGATHTINADKTGLVQLEGDIYVGTSSYTPIALSVTFGDSRDGQQSYFKGALQKRFSSDILDNTQSTANLNFGNGAYWMVTGNSNVDELTLNEGSRVTLQLDNSSQVKGASEAVLSPLLRVQKLIGVAAPQGNASVNAPVIEVGVLPQATPEESLNGLIFIKDIDATKNYLEIRPLLSPNDAGASIGPRSRTLVLDSADSGDLHLQLAPNATLAQLGERYERTVEVGEYLYDLNKYVDEDGVALEAGQYDQIGAEKGDHYYYLTWATNPTPDPDPNPDPDPDPDPPIIGPTAQTLIAMASMGAAVSQSQSTQTDLRERMGQLRRFGSHGLWVTSQVSRERLTGFDNIAYTADNTWFTLGADTQVNDLVAGVGFTYGQSDQKSQYILQVDGNAQSYGLSAYLAWMPADSAWYWDTIFAAQSYELELQGQMSNGTYFSGQERTLGVGVSTELGYHYDWHGFWVEPSLQASLYHFKGTQFTLSNAMTVKTSGLNSQTYKAGVKLGTDRLLWQGLPTSLYVKAGLAYEAKGEQTVEVNSAQAREKLLGTRAYYGAGVSVPLTQNVQAWVEIERESGHHYTKNFEANVGLKVFF